MFWRWRSARVNSQRNVRGIYHALKGHTKQHSYRKNIFNPVTDSFEKEDICGSLEDEIED